MAARPPVRAGTFYPADPDACAREAALYTDGATEPLADPIGGIAPHAGWVFSGYTAGRIFRALKDSGKAFSSFLFFGAAHTATFQNALYPAGAWDTPLGEVAVDVLSSDGHLFIGLHDEGHDPDRSARDPAVRSALLQFNRSQDPEVLQNLVQ